MRNQNLTSRGGKWINDEGSKGMDIGMKPSDFFRNEKYCHHYLDILFTLRQRFKIGSVASMRATNRALNDTVSIDVGSNETGS